jgi:EmrB/QacA subfamily drug resistance transporter
LAFRLEHGSSLNQGFFSTPFNRIETFVARAARKEAAIAAAKSGEQMSHREIILVLIGLMSGMFLSALDQSVVGSAMRTIADDLKGLELQAWVTTAYLITSTIATPIYGKLGDIFGRRRMFIIAISIFLLGSVLCGFALDMYQLAAYRAVQGIGAGGLFSLAITVLADIVPPRERARYQGMFLAVFGTSSVLGPVVGGLFASAPQILWINGWRWVFLINLPVGALALFMVVTFLHVPHIAKPQKIDWWGAVTIIMAVVPLLLVAENGNDWGWTSSQSITMYVVGAVGIIAFILAERAAGETALLPLKLFKSSAFSMSTVVGVIIGFGMFGGMMTLPLLLQLVNGASPTESGFMMLPMVAGLMTATVVSGQVTRKTGQYKIFLVTGTFLMLVGYVYMISYNAHMAYWQIAIGMVIIGLGLGQLMQTLTLVSQQSVPASEVGVATSSATFFRQMGGTLGVAVFISILFNGLGTTIGNAFKNKTISAGVLEAAQDPKVLANPDNVAFLQSMKGGAGSGLGDQLKTDSSFLSKIDPRLAEPFKVGFADSAVQVFIWASVVVAVAFAMSFFVKAPALRNTSASQEAREAAAAASAH